ncbi:MAG: outer-membrane lipoprotein carrier protein LolA [Candidatus Omnitrophica bacterium]|nr:outer-membrane lipoprotein carrier protein LolA [Candidatus Omnitrophota bacterium]
MRYWLSVLILLWPSLAGAQQETTLPPEARELVSKAAAASSYSAQFMMETKEEDGQPVRLEGRILFQQPNKRRLEIRQGPSVDSPQVIIADGKTEWHFDPASKQVLRGAVPPQLPGPHKPFGEAKEGTVHLVQKMGEGAAAVWRFEAEPSPLIAESAPVPIKVLRMDISPQDGLLRRLSILDEAGNEVLSQSYSDVETNIEISNEEFVFEPPDGAQVVDIPAQKPLE